MEMNSKKKHVFLFTDYVCGGVVGVGEKEDWEMLVLMNELEMSLFFFFVFQKK